MTPPKLIEEYNDPFELLVIEIEVENGSIRIMTGCGPQENWDESRRLSFFIALEAEIVKSELAGKPFIIEMDANSKLGKTYIPKDPHEITPNGKVLAAIIERHALVVANGSEQCSGVITRTRSIANRTERSCIDVVIFSSELRNHFKSLIIDEERNHVLTKIRKTKNGFIKKESDHNILITEFACNFKISDKSSKVDVYNLKNPECQTKFKRYTSNTNMLSSVFNSKDDINIMVQRFLKKVDGCIKMNFKRVRINKLKKSQIEVLYDRLRLMKGKEEEYSKEEVEEVVEAIATEEEKKYQILMTELDKIKSNDGRINAQKFWKINKKMFPKSRDPPAAIYDKKENLLTANKAIEERVLEVYSERLQPNTIKAHLNTHEKNVEKLCHLRLKQTENNKTEPWTMEEFDEAVKDLDNDK